MPIARPKFIICPPSLRFPPLREGNRERRAYSVPPACRLKGVGFFSRGRHGGRDARVPSVARAGSASVSLAWRQKCPARQRREQARPPKTYPFKRGRLGGGHVEKPTQRHLLPPLGVPEGGCALSVVSQRRLLASRRQPPTRCLAVFHDITFSQEVLACKRAIRATIRAPLWRT